jgi:SSS family solute:Na+ symporter
MLIAAIPASAVHIRALDMVVIVAYVAGITVFGLRFRKRDRSLASYFLADRNVPWWAIALSIVAAETSTLTIISIPGLAYAGDLGFLQIVFGYLLGRVALCILFLPRYARGDLLTAYQLIDARFGPTLHRLTALVFLMTRAAAEGVRVFAISIVVSIAIGTGDTASIVIMLAITLLYTLEGGMEAVIWTDVLQTGIYIVGSLVALFTLAHRIPGHWARVYAVTHAAGKLTVFHFAFNLSTTYTFWAGLIGGCFLTMASHGTDQLMVQRVLAARNLRDSRVALMASGGIVLFQFTVFLLIGAALFVFYQDVRPTHIFTSTDRIFPSFIVEEMPSGIAGLMLAAVLAAAMSNLSAALNSLSSTTVVDFYLKLRPTAAEKQTSRVSRIATLGWAVALCLLALLSRTGGHVVEVGLSIASVAYGGLLGVFLLGTLTQRTTELGAGIGMVVGLLANLVLWRQSAPLLVHIANLNFTLPKVAWTWYVVIGTTLTFAVGYVSSLMLPGTGRNIREVRQGQ